MATKKGSRGSVVSTKKTGGTSKTTRSAVTGRVAASTLRDPQRTGAVRTAATQARASSAAATRAPSSRTPELIDWKASERADFLIEAFGGVSKLADALGVSKSQPGRWRSGVERPGVTAARNLLDLDHVMGRASQVWRPDVAARWMGSSNAFLQGSRPIDVLMTRGPNDVINALDATLSGAFA
jgi:hypothetical protein